MFLELEKYSIKGHFFFSKNDELEDVCNAPDNGIGVYYIYALKDRKVDLVYIGRCGKISQDGSVIERNGGMADRIVNGKQFGFARKKSWKEKLIAENIEALDIYWCQTFDKEFSDIPSVVEGGLIQKYYNAYGVLPSWNIEF